MDPPTTSIDPQNQEQEQEQEQEEEEERLKRKVIQWEEFEQQLARLSSLSSALQQAQQQKLALRNHLQTLIQVSGRIRVVAAEE